MRYIWRDVQGLEAHREALARLAAEVTYLGHSHTLVRVALVTPDGTAVDEAWLDHHAAALRVPYARRMEHLEQRFAQAARPHPSLVARTITPSRSREPSETAFDSDNVTVFADAGGFCPSLVAFPLVAKRLRDALLDLAPKDAPIPALLSGHDADGRPTTRGHIAILPLADVGWAYSQGRLMGIALAWPRDVADDDRRAVLKAVAAFLRPGRAEISLLHFGRDGSWSLAIEPEPERASLRFSRYASVARRWGTVLPAALDRYPKDKPGEDLASIIVSACRNMGLPDAALDGLQVEVHKHGAISGTPPAPDVRKCLAQDSPYRAKPLAHLVINFAQPIRGPLMLGAGRFRGLGLCLPLDSGAAQ